MDYQQPTVNTNKTNSFATASLIFGVLAFVTILTAFLPLLFGGLSILFAVLSHRKGKRMETPAFAGVISSTISIAFATLILTLVLSMMPTMLKDPAYREQLNTMSETMYGITFDEMLEEGYGMDLDELLGDE